MPAGGLHCVILDRAPIRPAAEHAALMGREGGGPPLPPNLGLRLPASFSPPRRGPARGNRAWVAVPAVRRRTGEPASALSIRGPVRPRAFLPAMRNRPTGTAAALGDQAASAAGRPGSRPRRRLLPSFFAAILLLSSANGSSGCMASALSRTLIAVLYLPMSTSARPIPAYARWLSGHTLIALAKYLRDLRGLPDICRSAPMLQFAAKWLGNRARTAL